MIRNGRVIWSEGMPVKVQHFQQADRWTEAIVTAAAQAATPFPWGFAHAEIDAQKLEERKLVVTIAAGILPDGTHFRVSGDESGGLAPIPALEVNESHRGLTVALAAPMKRHGVVEVRSPDYEGAEDPRFADLSANVLDIAPGKAMAREAEIRIASPRLRLLPLKPDQAFVGDETESPAGQSYIPLARIIELDGNKVVLDRDFIPTVVHVGASRRLCEYVDHALGALRERANELAGTVGDVTGGRVASPVEFQQLQLFNRMDAELTHLASLRTLPPERLFGSLRTFTGELATFMRREAGRRIPDMPTYDHADLTMTFGGVMKTLIEFLSYRSARQVEKIEFKPLANNRFAAAILDRSLFTNTDWVLRATARGPKGVLKANLPSRIKIASRERLDEAMKNVAAAIPIRPTDPPGWVPPAPDQTVDSACFEINRVSKGFASVEASAALAALISAPIPEFRLTLFVRRRGDD